MSSDWLTLGIDPKVRSSGGRRLLGWLRSLRKQRRLERRREQEIRGALQQALGVRIGAISRSVATARPLYRAEIPGGAVFVRPLSGHDGANEGERALQIAQLLGRIGVPQAELLHLDRSASVFPHGFLVQEWVNGTSALALIQAGLHSEEGLYRRVGEMLRSIHCEAVTSFGKDFWQPNAQGAHDFFDREDPLEFLPLLRRLNNHPGLPMKLFEEVLALAQGLHPLAANDDRPVLVHGDLHADNLLVDGERIVIIDWFNAHGGSWVADFARTRWLRSTAARQALVQGFGDAYRTGEPWQALELYHSIRFQLGLVEYYAVNKVADKCRDVIAALEAEVSRYRAELAL